MLRIGLTGFVSAVLFAQSSASTPKFEIADVHVSAKVSNPFPRISPGRGGRYEIRTATMVDLIRTAYGFDADKVVGGPSWLELDRFDVVARVPSGATSEDHKPMLQGLLQERFKLVTHNETRQLPSYALIAGKKPQLKEAEGSGVTGCQPRAASDSPSNGGLTMMGANGAPVRISFGPGMVIHFECRNMTMVAFAAGMRGMIGAGMGPNAVVDETGLKGVWVFDLRYPMQMFVPPGVNPGERITFTEAVEKQLGLKLEQRPVPTPVIVVDSVERTPTANAPEAAAALPPAPIPTEFEVTNVKPMDPGAPMNGMSFQFQPGGRLISKGLPLRSLIGFAFDAGAADQIAGLPGWAQSERYDITAQAPPMPAWAPPLDMRSAAPMLRALLADRFRMKHHTEERVVSAHSLVAVKPKMKKADPASRTSCKNPTPPPGTPPGSQYLECHNTTMAQLSDRLKNMGGPNIPWPVVDETGLEDGYDFTLTFSNFFNMGMAPRRATEPGQPGADVAMADDPTGVVTLFQAIEKQLGLKLETRKRKVEVIVIDSIEQKPTEN